MKRLDRFEVWSPTASVIAFFISRTESITSPTSWALMVGPHCPNWLQLKSTSVVDFVKKIGTLRWGADSVFRGPYSSRRGRRLVVWSSIFLHHVLYSTVTVLRCNHLLNCKTSWTCIHHNFNRPVLYGVSSADEEGFGFRGLRAGRSFLSSSLAFVCMDSLPRKVPGVGWTRRRYFRQSFGNPGCAAP